VALVDVRRTGEQADEPVPPLVAQVGGQPVPPRGGDPLDEPEQRLEHGELVGHHWGSAPDYVEAMWRMLQLDAPGDYVVASGETHSIRELCQVAFDHVGLDWRDHVVQDQRFYRPAEVDLLIGDPSRAMAALDWKPRTSFEELVRTMVDADLVRLRKD
jgi:GDP-mannose 4,6-dehydratase